jgi:ABC-type polysaccharide/polyol phosphate transport system ATPase subunit
MENYAVKFENVSMKMNLAKEKVESLKEYFIRFAMGRKVAVEEFYALKNISFEIRKGDSFAIVGSNGSGKSTTLKLISGIYYPTTGNVRVNGKVAPMIELGAGFDMDLTAAENIYLNGAVLGYSRGFMKDKFDEIMDFSELIDFVDVPLKNYSSGMQARLGFAIATVIKPEILVVDEILSVGDAHFQDKCQKKMEDMMSDNATLILVSHSVKQILDTCHNAIWINKGHLMACGSAKDVCAEYMANKDI